jgi:hypothetical protein
MNGNNYDSWMEILPNFKSIHKIIKDPSKNNNIKTHTLH